MRRHVTIYQKPIALIDYPTERTAGEERCLVCDCRIPARAYIARTEDGYPICTASCMALVVITDDAKEHSDRVEQLREEAEALREQAYELDADADDHEREADKLQAEKDSRMRLGRMAAKGQQGGRLIDV